MTRRIVAFCFVPMLALACAPEGTTTPEGTTAVPSDNASYSRLPVAEQGGLLLTSQLTGAAEVAPIVGDADGTGSARVTINVGQSTLCYELDVANIAPATLAHIHVGPVGVNGVVVVGLTPPSSGSSSACVGINRDLAKAIAKNPADYYVNVHNDDHPRGAVRGQLQ